MKKFIFAVVAALALVTAPVLAQDSATPSVNDSAVEIAFWDSIKDSDDPMLYLAYLEQFPDGAFRVIAKNRMQDLWERAKRAFAMLDEMGVSIDGPIPAAPPPAAPQPPQVIVTQPSPPVVVTPPVSKPKTPKIPPKLITSQQNQLRKHLCYFGPVDGVWGPASRSAMRKFNNRAGTSFSISTPSLEAGDYMRKLSRAGTQVCR